MQLIKKPFLNKLSVVSFYLSIVISLNLTACSGSEHKKEVERYIAEMKAKPSQPLTSLPPLKEYVIPQYKVADLRSPFEPGIAQNSNVLRPKEPLENFPLDSLHLVGIIERNNQMWGLIAAPDNKIYQVAVGQYLGQSGGKVAAIHPKHIDVVEMIEDDGHLIEHHVKLILWANTQPATTNAK